MTPGSSSDASSRTRRSCVGSTKENDRQRLDALPLHAPQRAAHRLLVERRDDVALEVEPLRHAVALPPRADRRRRRERRVPDVLLVAAPDLDLVAMSRAGDETGDGARHLDHRVVGGRRAVHDQVGPREQLVERRLLARRELPDASQDAFRLVARCRGVLVEHQGAVADEHQVGERPADVDADAIAGARHAGWLHRKRRGSQGNRARATLPGS
jgi:hypothetical protein